MLEKRHAELSTLLSNLRENEVYEQLNAMVVMSECIVENARWHVVSRGCSVSCALLQEESSSPIPVTSTDASSFIKCHAQVHEWVKTIFLLFLSSPLLWTFIT